MLRLCSLLIAALVGFVDVAGFEIRDVSAQAAQPSQPDPDDHRHDAHKHPQVENLLRMISPPTGWQMDSNLSSDRARALASYPHLGGAHTLTSAEVWVPADNDKPSVVLVVSRVVATQALDTDDKLATAALAARVEFYKSVKASAAGLANELPAPVISLADDAVVMELRDLVSAPQVQATLRFARDAQRVETVTAECISSAEGAGAEPSLQSKMLRNCTTALASISPTIPVQKRLPLDAVLAALTANAFSPTVAVTNTTEIPTASFRDGGKITFPTMTLEQPRKPRDWRPLYVGGGILVCAIALYLNRRNRQRIEALDGRPIRQRRSTPNPPSSQDPS
jgi:hypothetical protein